jgi:hypothetical protein
MLPLLAALVCSPPSSITTTPAFPPVLRRSLSFLGAFVEILCSLPSFRLPEVQLCFAFHLLFSSFGFLVGRSFSIALLFPVSLFLRR